MAYLPVDFPTQTISEFAHVSGAPTIATPFFAALPSGLTAITALLGGTVLPVPPQASGGAGGGSVGYPH